MKYFVEIDVSNLPTCEYSTSAREDFKKHPKEVDILLATSNNYPRGICFRDGRSFDGLETQKGPGDVCTLCFDDFVPGMGLQEQPEWYKPLRNRIQRVNAEECYGPVHGIHVTEHRVIGSAVARIRQQQAPWGSAGQLVYVVKITAKGINALDDARKLHDLIISGE